MRKRRDRIERWRAEKKAQLEATGIKIEPPEEVLMPEGKKWTLDDEDEDDNEAEEEDDDEEMDSVPKSSRKLTKMKEKTEGESSNSIVELSILNNGELNREIKSEPNDMELTPDDDVDPLDAFMSDVSKEIVNLDKTKVKQRQENAVLTMETKNSTENKVPTGTTHTAMLQKSSYSPTHFRGTFKKRNLFTLLGGGRGVQTQIKALIYVKVIYIYIYVCL